MIGRPPKRSRSPLGERIAAARKALGYSQAKLAEILCLSQQTITMWERQSTALNTETVIRLAKALGVSADYLLGIENIEITKNKPGPTGKVQVLFEQVIKLPRRQQNKILDVVDALLKAQAEA
jgi:transcriptional regulator with XRE-family HTH domain